MQRTTEARANEMSTTNLPILRLIYRFSRCIVNMKMWDSRRDELRNEDRIKKSHVSLIENHPTNKVKERQQNSANKQGSPRCWNVPSRAAI